MPIGLANLLEKYAAAIDGDHSALFIGAGMSVEKVALSWRDLLRPYARLVNLDVDKENDLVAVAQYYLNSKNGERSFLDQALIDQFDTPGKFTDNHRIIAELRIPTIWTTNYDRLIEEAFGAAKKYVDVKIRDKDLGFRRKECTAVLYKMHGDISQPDEAIIGKEDYERYPRTHPAFQNTLITDLLRKRFLFLGLSFDDPNLNYMLGHLRSLLDNKKRGHFAIMRYVLRGRSRTKATGQYQYTESKEEFEYKKEKQARRVDDLQRYGIETILIDQFGQISEILNLLQEMRKGNEVDTRILPSEWKALELFEKIKLETLERLKTSATLSEDRLHDIAVETAKELVERDLGINIDHIEKSASASFRPAV